MEAARREQTGLPVDFPSLFQRRARPVFTGDAGLPPPGLLPRSSGCKDELIGPMAESAWRPNYDQPTRRSADETGSGR